MMIDDDDDDDDDDVEISKLVSNKSIWLEI